MTMRRPSCLHCWSIGTETRAGAAAGMWLMGSGPEDGRDLMPDARWPNKGPDGTPGQSPERGVGFRHGHCCASWAALRRARLAMASEATQRPLIEYFSALKDPRQIWKVVYPLPEIMLLVLCATLAGAEDFVEVRLWGAKNLDFLRRFLPFKDGLPSHDTLNDVINALDPALFKTCFVAWVEDLRDAEPDIVAIDGKTSRRTYTRRKGREPLHLVSAW